MSQKEKIILNKFSMIENSGGPDGEEHPQSVLLDLHQYHGQRCEVRFYLNLKIEVFQDFIIFNGRRIHDFSFYLENEYFRRNIAESIEKSFKLLSVKDAQTMLLFDKEPALLDFAKQRQWRVDGGNFKKYIFFKSYI